MRKKSPICSVAREMWFRQRLPFSLLGVPTQTREISAFSTVSAQETKPDFTDAATCSCSIQMTTDNLGKLNGYLVRLDIQ